MHKLLMVGFPSSGKSTFLAALWHVIDSSDVPGSLEQGRLTDSREYVELLRRTWLDFLPMERTLSTTRETVHIEAKNPSTGEVVTLAFPDLAGEVFDNHWRDRRWMADYAEQVQGATGILLFLHARKKYKPDLLKDYPMFQKSTVKDERNPEQRQENNEQENRPHGRLAIEQIERFNMDDACLQAKIVDMIQFHEGHVAFSGRLRLGVIISAWDAADEAARLQRETITPKEFILRNVPLLHQFLHSNRDRIDSRVWGVSAQGGELDSYENRSRLAEHDVAAQRIMVVQDDEIVSDNVSHDLSYPVRWLAFQ